jgi:hypothetical protein
MCKQAERDHETKKLVFLMERLKRQMAERTNGGTKAEGAKSSLTPIHSESGMLRLPIRSVPLER